MGRTHQDLTGQKFGRLTVIEYKGKDSGEHTLWLCECDCGNYITTRVDRLNKGTASSCGCLRTKHGMSHDRLYSIWAEMNRRCYDSGCPWYNRYGGRGIIVCEEWRNNLQAFCDWAMVNGYRDDLTIDRIDNDGNYEPSNCRWATRKEQANNKSDNRYITYKGKTMTLQQWADETGISRSAIYGRIGRLGWSMEKALSTPVHQCKKRMV